MERLKSFFERSETWFIENDLHIYLGVLSIVVISVLSWMLITEVQKNNILREQVVEAIGVISDRDRKISGLQAEVDLNKINTPTILENLQSRPVSETVEKGSNKLNAKIEKVQNTLINKPADTVIITKTETKTVEKPVPVDSELKAMMQQSYCQSYPEDKSCKKVKK
jgi:predicted HicB family RNase H-like nuclease